MEVVGYGAYHLDDTEGIPLLYTDKDPNGPKFRELKDYSKGFNVKAKAVSDFVYVAQLRITGKVQKNPTECRYGYRQGGKLYKQPLRCSFELRLKK
ncbi:hypothetical protein BKD26_04895 [Streptomyces sp. CB03238]|nr:hypothetical protein BKD26_04895 [Streptomyces sp. CB03238]